MLSSIFEKYGLHCLDTDKVSRMVCEPHMPCTLELARAFGSDILRDDGSLDRKALAKRVFVSDEREKNTALLNSITHKYILDEADKWLESEAHRGAPAAVVDAPVLFESGYNKKCDYIIGVLASKETRLARVMARDGIDRELALKRISAQQSDDFYLENCSAVFYNDTDANALESAALDCIRALLRGELPK